MSDAKRRAAPSWRPPHYINVGGQSVRLVDMQQPPYDTVKFAAEDFMDPQTEEVDVTCPHCKAQFVIEIDPPSEPEVVPNPGEGAMRHYRLSEVGEMLSVGRSTLKRWIKLKKIKAVKFGTGEGGSPWRISEEELVRFRATRGVVSS